MMVVSLRKQAAQPLLAESLLGIAALAATQAGWVLGAIAGGVFLTYMIAQYVMETKKDFDPKEPAFGNVGDVPDIPEKMAEILQDRCPFNPEKKVKDTHMLVLIPQEANRKPFTLNLSQELIPATNLQIRHQAVKNELAETPNVVETKKDFDPKELAFGKSDWEKHFGDVGDVPDIPEKMAEILQDRCPFNPEKKVKDTHMLVLIPQTVDGKPFTLNLLQELIQKHKEKEASRFEIYSDQVKNELGDKQCEEAHWILMTKDVIPGSRNKTYDEQKQLVKEKREGVYELPSAIEAAASILMHYFKTNEHLYGQHPWTYTRCQETVIENQWPVAIGVFSPGGLYVIYSDWDDYGFGVAAAWKF